MQQLILYSTLGCHLCDHAKEILWPILANTKYTLSEVDIADSEQLLELYGTSIPVLEYEQSGEKLYWPFDESQVRLLLNSRIS
ncbi:glutaredoxin family protein [Aurantivibrio plasticivorans]